ncbi:uncharacterized protein [Prorops nasuta]|uniref:uncharacterized protein n=1 Tax=Prorops nasuta TaxID=863751 RepID=UPI0034CE194B
MVFDEKPVHLKFGIVPKHFYKLNEILCCLAGKWPYQRTSTRFLINALTNIMLFLASIMQIIYLFETNFSIEELFQGIPVLVVLVLLFFINILFFVNANEARVLWEIIADDWASERTIEETRIKESLARLSHLITKALTFSLGIGTVLFLMASSFLSQIYDIIQPINGTHPLMLPFPVISLFDHEEYFLVSLIFQESTLILSMISAMAGQTSLCIHILHLYGMFYVIGYRLENAIPKSKLHNLSWIPCQEVDKDFRESIFLCIHRHRAAFKLVLLYRNL